ncbi:putative concanavalin A-like lectin/glucanase domain-containing protein [Medicago truncatula]|uniref:RING-type E3 ubiquitin transferase n=1 Tax=Medicago truncatula TaxID=3880 RepID=A0A396JNG1_MEDTR|nr:putative concanavalin A-like lectin/glucanase domain-containing protein [Medicago truncatula]
MKGKGSLITTLIVLLLLNKSLGNGLSDASIGCPFKLNCTHNMNILELPTHPVPVKLMVTDIDYRFKSIDLSDTRNCLPQLLFDHNFSSIDSLKLFVSQFLGSTTISFFDCSWVLHLRKNEQIYNSAQDMISCPIYVADSDLENIVESDLVYCIKLFDHVSSFDASTIQYNRLSLTWSGTNFDIGCLKCEHKSKKKITFVILSSADETAMIFSCHFNFLCIINMRFFRILNVIHACVIIGSTLLVLVLGAIVRIHRHFKMKGEDHERIENFLKDYKALKPTRFSYADIKRITNKFKDKIGEGAQGAVYKGNYQVKF